MTEATTPKGDPIEEVVPSYDLWRKIQELREGGTIVVILPHGMGQRTALQSVCAGFYGLGREGDVPVRVVVARGDEE